MIDTRTVIHFMSRKGYHPVNFPTLAKQMHVTGSPEKRELQDVVSELESHGIIRQRKKGSLALAHPRAFVTGVIDVKRRGFGFVTPSLGDGPDIYIAQNSIGHALDGDTVLIERLPSRRRRGVQLESAKVVQVLERGQKRIVGTINRWRKRYYVVPDGKAAPVEIGLSDGNTAGAREGDKVILELSPRPSDGLVGRIVKVLGDGTDPSTDIPMVISQRGIRDEFPSEVLAEAEKFPRRVVAADIKDRVDLRNERIITIDPESAQDFDDAISLKRTRSGWKLGVHIADVSHYVRPTSAIWEEAAIRTTSIYLPTHTIPMLPESLSNNLCSLRPDEDRLTLSVQAELDSEGAVDSFTVVNSVIRSARRLTYAEAMSAISGAKTALPPDITKLLKDASQLAKLLNKRRARRGALELDMPEVELEYDDEGNVTGAHPAERDVAHRMIEEFMLLANECVARFAEDRGRRVIHRSHEGPDRESLSELADFAKTIGISVDTSRGPRKALQGVLDRVRDTPLAHSVNLIVLRTMKHAEYLPESTGHFALAAEHYCHFTSPIRRFADLVVHSVLKERDLEVGRRRPFNWSKHLAAYCRQASEMEKVAEKAERDVVKLKLLRFLQDRIGDEITGIIVGIQDFGAFVELDEVPVDGLVSVRSLNGRFQFDERAHTLTCRRPKLQLRLGGRVKVTIESIDLERRELDLGLVSTLK